jgi:hypothetical protein
MGSMKLKPVALWIDPPKLTRPALEAQSISTMATTLSGAQDSQRTKDGWATAAAVVRPRVF